MIDKVPVTKFFTALSTMHAVQLGLAAIAKEAEALLKDLAEHEAALARARKTLMSEYEEDGG